MGAGLLRHRRHAIAWRFVVATIAFVAIGFLAQPGASGHVTQSTALSCGGEVPAAKPDGTAWNCTFDDEFAQDTTLNPVWSPVQSSLTGVASGTAPYRACYVNSPNNVSVSNGRLVLTVRRERHPFTCQMGPNPSFSTYYSVGAVSTVGKFGQTNGRFEVRAKLPNTAIKGLQETLWLWPTNDIKYASSGPAWAEPTGEIDFAEFYSSVAKYDIPYLHYYFDTNNINVSTGTNVYTPFQPPYNEAGTNCVFDYTAWNTFTLVWQPGRLTMYVNAQLCLVDNYQPAGGISIPAPFDQPFFIALSQALGVALPGSDNATTAQTPIPASTQIDYVRVWK